MSKEFTRELFFVIIIPRVNSMDIIYKKDTLYVYIDEAINEELVDTLESRVDHIMGTYNIENLVINAKDRNSLHFHEFETKYNSRHKSKVVIK